MSAVIESATALVSVSVHVMGQTALAMNAFPANEQSAPFVAVNVGQYPAEVSLLVHNADDLDRLMSAIHDAKQALFELKGLLPNGDPCEFTDVFGSLDWHEHNHDQCLADLLDEPVPYRPTGLGTAWERHDDPTMQPVPATAGGWS